MDRSAYTLVLMFVLVGLTACSPATKRVQINEALIEVEAQKQSDIALQSLIHHHDRLLRISYPLLVTAQPYCEDDTRASIGVQFSNKYSIPDDLQDAAQRKYDLGDPIQLLLIAPDSAADVSGLQPGDVLVSINGIGSPVGEDALEDLHDLLAKEIKSGTVTTLTIKREGVMQSFPLTPVRSCNYPVVLSGADEVNASADGDRIIITKGMMRFATGDQELSLVVAHELAHNAMGHIRAKTTNYLLGSVFDIAAAAYGVDTQGLFGNIAAGMYSQDFEAEADYVALYFMAQAELDIEGAANFWRRMAAEHPGSIRTNHAASHPATPERFLAIEQTVVEIEAKLSSGAGLVPEYKQGREK